MQYTPRAGGLCVVSENQIITQAVLPLAGFVSEASLEEVSGDFAAVRDALDKLVDWKLTYLVLKSLFGAFLVCNAGPRLSDVGIVDVFSEGSIRESGGQLLISGV